MYRVQVLSELALFCCRKSPPLTQRQAKQKPPDLSATNFIKYWTLKVIKSVQISLRKLPEL